MVGEHILVAKLTNSYLESTPEITDIIFEVDYVCVFSRQFQIRYLLMMLHIFAFGCYHTMNPNL